MFQKHMVPVEKVEARGSIKRGQAVYNIEDETLVLPRFIIT